MKPWKICLIILYVAFLVIEKSDSFPFLNEKLKLFSKLQNEQSRQFQLPKYLLSFKIISRLCEKGYLLGVDCPQQPNAEEGLQEDSSSMMPVEEGASNSTTINPIEAFCKSACPSGYGGDTCDCADHPIG